MFLDRYPIARKRVVVYGNSVVALLDVLYLRNELSHRNGTLIVGSDKGMTFKASGYHLSCFVFFSFFYISEMDNCPKMELVLLIVVMEGHSNDSGFALQQILVGGLH